MGAGAVAAKWRGFASRRVFGAIFGFQRFGRFGAFRPRFRHFLACFGPVLRLLKLQKVSELTYIILLSKISKLIYKPFMTKNSVLS